MAVVGNKREMIRIYEFMLVLIDKNAIEGMWTRLEMYMSTWWSSAVTYSLQFRLIPTAGSWMKEWKDDGKVTLIAKLNLTTKL